MKRKNFILFMIFILISLLLVSCGPKKEELLTDGSQDGVTLQDVEETLEQRMQKEKEIEEIESKFLGGVAQVLKLHNDHKYDIVDWERRKIVPGLLGVIIKLPLVSYFDTYDLGEFYNLFYKLKYSKDLEKLEYSKDLESRRKFYLAFEYNDDLLKPFAYVYGILSYDVANKLSDAYQNKDKILELKNSIVSRLINYAKAYYIDVYKALEAKKDRLDSLLLEDVRLLKSKLSEIELAKQKLRTDVIQNFVDGCKQYEPYGLSPKHNVWLYLKDKFKEDFATKCDAVIALAADIKEIFEKIPVKD
ncbi:virulence associated lipoprotein [Borrelia crocidurae]|uniref:virulence associated lipoprotein n=1 Tax=Borrelia crocidurae TaxID=29520 RepID=UPI00046CC9BA|nr:virulence associated lipoprotein [Borrelia crocidurae]